MKPKHLRVTNQKNITKYETLYIICINYMYWNSKKKCDAFNFQFKRNRERMIEIHLMNYYYYHHHHCESQAHFFLYRPLLIQPRAEWSICFRGIWFVFSFSSSSIFEHKHVYLCVRKYDVEHYNFALITCVRWLFSLALLYTSKCNVAPTFKSCSPLPA